MKPHRQNPWSQQTLTQETLNPVRALGPAVGGAGGAGGHEPWFQSFRKPQ